MPQESLGAVKKEINQPGPEMVKIPVTIEPAIIHEQMNKEHEHVEVHDSLAEFEQAVTTGPIKEEQKSELKSETSTVAEQQDEFLIASDETEPKTAEETVIDLPEIIELDVEFEEENPVIDTSREHIDKLLDEVIEDEGEQTAELFENMFEDVYEAQVVEEGFEDTQLLHEHTTPAPIEKTLFDILPVAPAESAEKLATILEKQIEEAMAIMEVVLQVAQKFEQIEAKTPEQIDAVTQRLEQVVERLFTVLEIDHDDEHVAVFVKAILSGEVSLDFENLLKKQDDGTHERKYVSDWIMAVLNQRLLQAEQRHSFVGKFVLRFSLMIPEFGFAAAS